MIEERTNFTPISTICSLVKVSQSDKLTSKKIFKEADENVVFEFNAMPANKAADKKSAQACDVCAIQIKDKKHQIEDICSIYNITKHTLCESIWAIILKNFNYANQAGFLTLHQSGEVCYHQIPDTINEFDKISQSLGAEMYDCKISTEKIDVLDEYYNKSIVEYVDITSDDSLLGIEKGLINLATTLRVIFISQQDELQIRILYNANYYYKESLEMLGEYVGKIIDNLYEKKEFKNKYIVTDNDIQLVKKMNDNTSLYCVENTVPKMIEIQARNTPDKVAVFANNASYTYAEVNGKANYLAQHLMHDGIQKGDFIPVLMNKSIELVVSLLAIMKSGGVFVPIDIKWPEEKIKNAIRRCKANIVLTNLEPVVSLEGVTNRFVSIQELEYAEDINVEIDLEDNIYAIFTSGSTGEPKGAINKQKGIVNRFLYMNKRYKIKENDRILLTSNHAFDSSVWQMFWPLINGNATVIPRATDKLDLFEIINLIDKYHITITDFVPSVFNLMVELLQYKSALREKLVSLRQLLIGGEEMSPKHIYAFKEMFPNCSITNTYGPAEASIGTVFYELPSHYIDVIPIGKPIDNVKAFVLNKNEELMPVGSIGMLYLGGICVGNGYVNEMDRTKKLFKTLDIYKDGTNFEVYKTGDMVQINDKGDLDFYGREDNQVKIQGVRVELKEIENELCKIQGVEAACVTCFEKKERKILSLYYVAINEDITEEYVKDVLKKKLPPYILTAFVKRIERIPLTNNGKVDFKSLPQPL